MALELTDNNFEELVKNSDKPVLVDFWAEWCGPCVAMAPMIDELAKEYEGRAVVGKFDVGTNPKISVEYGVRLMPTTLIFKNGAVVDKVVGAVAKHTLVKKLESQLS
ncbi:MAG: thioredoxin [Bacteroidia bacterium]